MRVSTMGQFQQALNQMLRLQTETARTQLQVGSGQRHLSAADDPAAVAGATRLDTTLAGMSQFAENANLARQRLQMEESALNDVADVLQRLRELAVRGSNDTLADDDRAAVAAEVRSLQDQLLGLANSADGRGRYLFAGSADAAAPFAKTPGGGVTYSGDDLARQVPIDAARTVADGDTGSDVFLRVPAGNGTFSVAVQTANTGGGYLRNARVADAAAYDGGDYTIGFSGGGYTVTDSAGATIASGTYTADQPISFRGLSLTFNGSPDDGDAFNLTTSRSASLFSMAGDLAGALSNGTPDPVRRTAMVGSLSELDGALNHIQNLRTGVGVRLQALDRSDAAREGMALELEASLSDLRDVDIAEAATRLSIQSTALQAAQNAFVRVQGLSLFNFLR